MSHDPHIFEENLKRLQMILPKLAIKLPYVDSSSVQFSQTRMGELNLVKKLGGEVALHSNYSAVKEAEKWASQLKLDETKVLYVFGIGLGYAYDALKSWLDLGSDRYLVFLEHDLAVIKRIMQTKKGTEILDDKQVQLHYFSEDPHEGGLMIEWLSWYFVQSQFDIVALPAYERAYMTLFANLRVKISHDSVVKNSIVGEYMRFGNSFYRNFYLNMLHLSESSLGNHLFGKFENVPAIICGAGPSLNKNLEVLKTLGQNALIFAGGSSMNALTNNSFLPHFGAGIDPNPPQYNRLISNAAYEVPYFYRNRMFHEAFRLIHGPRLYITGCGGYYTSDWFEEKLKIKGDMIDEGHNVVNFSMEIAQAMGCNPIILVGLDLAYTGLKSYASGVIQDPNLTEKAILETKDLDSSAFLRPDIDGKPVYTLWKWVAEAEWIADFAKRYPKKTVINATEGGIGFEGIANSTLAKVKEQFLTREYDLRSLVHLEIENATMAKVTPQKVLLLMEELYQSLSRAITLCEDVLQEIEKVRERITSTGTTDGNLQTGKIALAESDLSGETCFEAILNVFAVIYNKVLARETHQIRYDKHLKNDAERDLKRLEINVKKFSFLKDVAKINQEVMKESLLKYRDAGHAIGPFFEQEFKLLSAKL